MIEAGNVCEVLCGRRSGEKVTVKKVIAPYALAVDSKGKERKYSIRHLKPISSPEPRHVSAADATHGGIGVPKVTKSG